jgi:hypothetical protein
LACNALGTIMLDRAVQRFWGLTAAHFIEVVLWALFYDLLGVSPPGTDALYFALVNYTTLGHGEAVPGHDWTLLGPITAANCCCSAGRRR